MARPGFALTGEARPGRLKGKAMDDLDMLYICPAQGVFRKTGITKAAFDATQKENAELKQSQAAVKYWMHELRLAMDRECKLKAHIDRIKHAVETED